MPSCTRPASAHGSRSRAPSRLPAHARAQQSRRHRERPRRCARRVGAVCSGRLRQPVTGCEPCEVALVEELDLHIRVELSQLAELPVLAGDERLLHHGHLQVQVLVPEVEVGRERLGDAALIVAGEHEGRRLVFPRDSVPVQDLCVLELRRVGKAWRLRAAECLENRRFRLHIRQRSNRFGCSRVTGMGPLTIAHLSDLHCGEPHFVPDLMERAIAEINELKPDIVVCSGDLTTFGFKEEYAKAKRYLDRIECEALVVVPGNHDSRNVGYVHFEELFGKRNSVLRRSGVTVVAVDSTEPDLDNGQIGRGRYSWIEEQFAAEPADLRIFVLHHHLLPIPGTGRERNVVYDAGDAIECLQRAGVHLVLSGHKHVPYAWKLESLFVINTGTVATLRLRGETRPCYNVMEVTGTHVAVWWRYLFHGQERIIQFDLATGEYEKYTGRIEREVTAKR